MTPPEGFDAVQLVGVGATSRVFRAVHVQSGRVVALKRLHRQLVRTHEALARLRREFVALSRLHHPGIVAVHDVIRWDGDPTVVMEFVDGEDLKQRIARQGRLAAAEVEGIARALLDALAAAHGAGIVHRDIKPQNLRIDAQGRVRLLDFGSARLDASAELTHTGSQVGTPDYMAPELFAGSVYDPRVDLFGVGATLFEALTGRPPQVADSLVELAFLRSQVPIAAVQSLQPEVPDALAHVVDRCLRRAPEQRFASAALAVWALDHPRPERLFEAQRSNQPLCLHCHQPIPSASTLCSHCKTERPFVYPAGLSHVELECVRDPDSFIEHVVSQFPEQADRAHLEVLGQRCAALSFERQRYTSFISAPQAQRIVDELAAVGVESQVVCERRWPAGIAAVLGLGFFISQLDGAQVVWQPAALLRTAAWLILPLLFYLVRWVLAERLLSMLASWHGLLSGFLIPKTLWLGLQRQSAALVLFAATLVPGLWLSEFDRLTFGGAAAATSIMLAALLALSYAYHFPNSVADSPEPGLWTQLKLALGVLWSASGTRAVDGPAAASRAGDPAPGRRPRLALSTTALFVLLVPLEIVAISMQSSCTERMYQAALLRPHRQAAAPEAPTTAPPVEPFRPFGGAATGPRAPDRPAGDDRGATEKRSGKALDSSFGGLPLAFSGGGLDASRPGGGVRRGLIGAIAVALGLLPLVALVLLVPRLHRRRLQIRAEGRRIVAELPAELLARLAQRSVPDRLGRGWGFTDAVPIAGLHPTDAFTRTAVEGATELAPFLSAESLRQLGQALETLTGTAAHPARSAALREEALLSRCILETDQDFAVRLQFLALLGRVEAEAASQWAAKLRGAER